MTCIRVGLNGGGLPPNPSYFSQLQSYVMPLWKYWGGDSPSQSAMFSFRNLQRVASLLKTGSALIDSGKRRPIPLSGKLNSDIARYAEMNNVIFENAGRRREAARMMGMRIDETFETANIMLMYKAPGDARLHPRGKPPPKTKATICFRGTKVTDFADLQTDYAIWQGRETKTSAFANALLATRMAVNRYGKRNVTVTGFSLGGRIGIYVATQLDLPAHVFNPGISFKPFITKLMEYIRGFSTPEKAKLSLLSLAKDAFIQKLVKKQTKINIYIVEGDIISNYLLFSEDSGHTIHLFKRQPGVDPHYLGNFQTSQDQS